MKTAKQVYKEIVSPVGNFEGGTLMDEIIRAMEEYASQFKTTPSSTVDLEREAEELYPDPHPKEMYYDRAMATVIMKRTCYIKGRQTSQKGLVEFIEWAEANCESKIWETDKGVAGKHVIDLQALITKATELLTKK